MLSKLQCLLPLLTFLCCLHSSVAENTTTPLHETHAMTKEFVPTHEWQVIPPDTAVPPGLHYRMDLSTGEKWAKLLDSEEDKPHVNLKNLHIKDSHSSSTALELSSSVDASLQSPPASSSHASHLSSLSSSHSSHPSNASHSSDVSASSSSAEPAPLSPFKQKEKILLGTGLFDNVLKADEMSEESYTALVEKLWEQRQAEVRAVYEMMEHADKVIDPFISALWEVRPQTDSHELLQKLEKLEEMISTEDMAFVFVERGGWAPLVKLLHPSHSSAVRASAAWVVGSALRQHEQNNVWALEPRGKTAVPLGSALYQLMEIMDSRETAVHSHEEEMLLSKAVYAISAGGTSNQEVQTHLLGPFLTSLGQLLSEDWSTALRIKVLQFATDMMMIAQEDTSNSEHYARLRMSLSSWCGGIHNLTEQVVSDPSKLEKTLEAAVYVVKQACPSSFHDLTAVFKQAQQLYANGNKVEIGEVYKTELLQALANTIAMDRQDL